MKNKLYTKIIKLLEQMDWKMTEAQNNLPNIALICSLNGKDTNSKIIVNFKKDETKMDAPGMTEILEELGLIDEVDKLEQLTDTVHSDLEVLQIVKYILSEEGVKSFIVKKILDVLNNRLLFYLQKMDANCICRFNEYFEE